MMREALAGMMENKGKRIAENVKNTKNTRKLKNRENIKNITKLKDSSWKVKTPGLISKHGLQRTGMAFVIMLVILITAGCAKENKYVNIGVNMSTAGMSLYLTNTVNGFEKISNYVYFATSSQDSLDKIRQEKQGIDITYLPVSDLGLIKADDGLKVVFPDCLDDSGELKGVWVANTNWLNNAPNYSYRFIKGLIKSADYRASHMNRSYEDALRSVKGVIDINWEKYPEVMQYCAVYAVSNNEELEDESFVSPDMNELMEMFEGFSSGTGRGYELCRSAYDKYCAQESKSFEELFDMSLAVKALKECLSEEQISE